MKLNCFKLLIFLNLFFYVASCASNPCAKIAHLGEFSQYHLEEVSRRSVTNYCPKPQGGISMQKWNSFMNKLTESKMVCVFDSGEESWKSLAGARGCLLSDGQSVTSVYIHMRN